MKTIVLAATLALVAAGCDPPTMSIADKLTVCRAICDKRAIDTFEVADYGRMECRCGPMPPACDGGR